MDVRPAVRAALLVDAAIWALAGDRIYPAEAPQGERRALIVVNRISEREEPTMGGPSGLLQSRVQVDAWGPTPDAASALADAVRARLNGLSGIFGGLAVAGSFAGSIREGQDRDTGAWRVGRDFTLWTRIAP